MPRKLIAASLSLILVSCSATRYAVPTDDELPQLVLVIKDSPDGQISHSWQRAEDFDLAKLKYHSDRSDFSGRVMLATDQQDDCYAQYLECYYQCRMAPVPSDFDHYLYDFGPSAGHERYCSEKCMRKYTECLKGRGQRQQEFTAVDDAVDWLKRHRKTLLAGSLVVIAGVIFVVVSAGAGLVVLAPIVLVTTSLPPLDPTFATVPS